jgi:hypothetical protein
MSRVFRKTALGIATFSKQNSGLTQAQRGLLIMVDGKRSASQLRKFSASFGDVNAILRELYDSGLIELDTAYVEQLKKSQTEIARELRELPSAFAAETVMAGARAMPTAVKATLAAARNSPKRDLRDFASLGAPDPVLAATRGALALTPVAGTSDAAHVSSASNDAIAKAKHFAMRYLFNALGNSGTALCFAIERADGLKSLLEMSEVAATTLGSMKGESHASEFRKKLREALVG